MTRILLISGKGGVGKTTIAATSAVKAAAHGHRTLVLSLDRAHNLGDVLGVGLAATPIAVPGCSGLSAMEVDPQAELRQHEAALETYLARFLEWAGISSGVHADEVAVIPGLEELLMLSRLASIIDAASADFLVVDLAPTASSLKLLSFPEIMAGPVGKLVAWERRFFRLARPAAKKLLSAPIPEDAMYEALDVLAARLGRLRELLLDGRRAVVRLVSIPERVVIDETRSAYTALSLFGISVDSVILNRVLPDALAKGYLREWTQIQAREIERAQTLFPGLIQRQLYVQRGEVIGIEALTAAATALYGDADPADFGEPTRSLQFVTRSGTTTLSLRLPHGAEQALDLQQRDNELIVTVGAWRRRLLLPASLHGRAITQARFADGALHIDFEPRKDAS